MMNLQHRVKINIADRSGQKKQVLESKSVHIPQRLLNFFFGEFCEVLVLTPGKSVIPIGERYALTVKEAAQYFNIGIKKMRRLAEENLGVFAVFSGNRYLIIRTKFEEYLLEKSTI